MQFRLLGAPWWVRWLVLTCEGAVVLAVAWLFGIPPFRHTTGLIWAVGISVVAIGALLAAIQQTKHRAYVRALQPLSREQRSQAVRSVSAGDIPVDPAVLSAAVKIAGIRAAGRDTSRRTWIVRLLLPAAWLVLAVLDIATGQVREGLGWAILGVFFAAASAWEWYDLRRLRIRTDLMRDAAHRLEATG